MRMSRCVYYTKHPEQFQRPPATISTSGDMLVLCSLIFALESSIYFSPPFLSSLSAMPLQQLAEAFTYVLPRIYLQGWLLLCYDNVLQSQFDMHDNTVIWNRHGHQCNMAVLVLMQLEISFHDAFHVVCSDVRKYLFAHYGLTLLPPTR